MSEYSSIEKLLHKIYLPNYFISKSSLEVEKALFGNDFKNINITQYVFVTGLARSGTTSILRKLYDSNEFASLTYSQMPFLFMPNLWKNSGNIKLTERAHKDGIQVDSNSPEEFDEYFWKVYLKDSYIKEELITHLITEKIIDQFKEYVFLICKSQGKDKYLSKNNNNILRLGSIKNIDNSKFIFLFRKPIDHAASLLKLHKRFSEMQSQDSFIVDYFNFLGHYEFGINHKPFLLLPEFLERMNSHSKDNINYWLLNWMNYYSYLIDNLPEGSLLISFNDIINSRDRVYNCLREYLGMVTEIPIGKEYKPPTYQISNYDKKILNEANEIYEALDKRKIY